jgi:prepilin signal peptidase PulO-like enzyme (type II secretory pathway)
MELPEGVRVTCVVLAGLALAAFSNWAIYTLAYFPRPISPWGAAPAGAPPRRWYDRLPIVGWWTLRREAGLHGSGFWIRPLLIELCFPLALAAYYLFVTAELGFFPEPVRDMFYGGSNRLAPEFAAWLHWIFVGHALLAGLMLSATFIDFDEQTVPDWITVPGTLLGLILASFGSRLFLPYLYIAPGAARASFEPLLLTAPQDWNPELGRPRGLWMGVLIYSLWCFALADRRVIFRRGWRKAVQYFFAGLVRHPSWKVLVGIWLLGLGLVGVVYSIGGDAWRGLLTSLVGLAVGGGTVWAVRLVAGGALRQEAMGFGDVTLMAMIGSFVGWQVSLFAFVLAPLTAVLIVLVQFVVTRNRVTAFGPYLCAGTVVTLLCWPVLWERFGAIIFGFGPILVPLLVSLLLLMGGMLAVWRMIREAILS